MGFFSQFDKEALHFNFGKNNLVFLQKGEKNLVLRESCIILKRGLL
jgi:hypothetical protein